MRSCAPARFLASPGEFRHVGGYIGQAVSAADGRLAKVVALVAAEPHAPEDAPGTMGALRRLCGAAVQAIPASGVGLSVITDSGDRGVAAASDAASVLIDGLQFTLGEGPCLDAFASRRPVLESDLGVIGTARWPIYSPAACNNGVRAAFAFPLQIGAARLGVLGLYRKQPGSLSAGELAQALSFADVATTMLLDAQEKAPPGAAPEGLDEAMEHHFELFQAQGMVMVMLGITVIEALAVLRGYAYAHDRDLADVARDVVTRRLRLDEDRDDA